MQAILGKILIHFGIKYGKQILIFIATLIFLIIAVIAGFYSAPAKIQHASLVNAISDTKQYTGVDFVTLTKGYSFNLADFVYAFPTTGIITQKVKNVGYAGNAHLAWDIANSGDKVPVYATFDGTIVVSKLNIQHTNYQWRFCGVAGGICYDKIDEYKDIVYGCGNEIQIEANSVETLRFMYCHLENRFVETGQLVKRGDIIGYMGKTGWATGQHLHFAIYYKGDAIDPKYFYEK